MHNRSTQLWENDTRKLMQSNQKRFVRLSKSPLAWSEKAPLNSLLVEIIAIKSNINSNHFPVRRKFAANFRPRKQPDSTYPRSLITCWIPSWLSHFSCDRVIAKYKYHWQKRENIDCLTPFWPPMRFEGWVRFVDFFGLLKAQAVNWEDMAKVESNAIDVWNLKFNLTLWSNKLNSMRLQNRPELCRLDHVNSHKWFCTSWQSILL